MLFLVSFCASIDGLFTNFIRNKQQYLVPTRALIPSFFLYFFFGISYHHHSTVSTWLVFGFAHNNSKNNPLKKKSFLYFPVLLLDGKKFANN